MLKKICIFFLVMILCLGSMTSCFIVINEKDDESDTPETTAETDSEKIPALTDVLDPGRADAESALEGLFADKNFEGQSLSLVIAEDSYLNLNAEQETSYSRALQIQSQLVSTKLNCTIYVSRTPYNTFLSDAQAAMNAGLFYADLVCVPQRSIGYMRNQGMVADLNALYGNVFTEECYDLDAKSQVSGNNRIYGIAGEATVTPGAYACVYFNKSITDQYGVTKQIYEAVENGSWTIDKMIEFKNACAFGHDETITFGANGSDMLIQSLFGATGMKYMNTSFESVPAVADNGDRLNSFVSKMKTLVNDAVRCTYADNSNELFEEGKVLFYIDTLESASTLKGAYGVVPLPKLEAEQESYYTYTDGSAYVFAVLNTNNRPQYAVDMIRAFNETAGILHDAWARDLLDYALRDSKSYDMVKLIFKNANYDFAYMYGEVYASVADSSYNALIQSVMTNSTYDYYVRTKSAQLKKDMTALFS